MKTETLTKRKWKIDEAEDLPLAIIEDTEGGEGILEMGDKTPENIALAKLICKAVNNHEALLSALKKCYPYIHDLEQENFDDRTAGIFKDEHLTIAFEALNEAIKKAEL